MLRSALGLGAAGVVALKGTAELTNPKVLRGSMGALFRLPAVAADAESYLSTGRRARRSRPGSPRRTARSSRRDRCATHRAAIGLVVGNEGAGVGPALEAAASRRVAIRLAPGAESLNVAVAAAILLREVARGD